MDHWHLVRTFFFNQSFNHVVMKFPVLALVLIFGAFLSSQIAFADHHGNVRIYKLNSKDQFVKQRWLKDRERPGCHDLRRSRKAIRFAQTGFAWCTVYSGDDCQAGSELPALWGGKNYRTADIDISQPQVKLLQGSEWYLHPDKNIRIGSWRCEYAE
ncbi:MAG: hypothetical protein KTR18_12135 [Acidiferrobacterales bacterium]|nr:hypothetical protein [Acidiferrobacterales bacterium]